MKITKTTKLVRISTDEISDYLYGTTLTAKNPKSTHKYVQHLKNLRDAGFATMREICPEVVGNPVTHEFVQFCKLGLAEKYSNIKGTRVFYKITPKGRRLLKKAGV